MKMNDKTIKNVEMDMSTTYKKTSQASVGDETKKVIFLFILLVFILKSLNVNKRE